MHTIKYLGPLVLSTVLQSNVQAQDDLSANLKADRMKKIMYENYESSHTISHKEPMDSIPRHAINGQQTIKDHGGRIVKQGDFRNGVLRDGYLYKYNNTALLETHIYKNGNYMSKVIP